MDINSSPEYPVERIFNLIFPQIKRIIKMALGLEPPYPGSVGRIQEILINGTYISYIRPSQNDNSLNDGHKKEIWSKEYLELVKKKS